MSTDGTPFMPAILERIAARAGAEVTLEPEFRIVGHVRFPNGRHSYFWHNKFNLNPISSVRIAQDKGYTAFFLRQAGFAVPRAQTFFRDGFSAHRASGRGWQAACAFAESIGWPVYVKPCRGSQGRGIELATNPRELRAVLARRFAEEKVALVQERCLGRDYRVVVLDGAVISAYERVPLTVRGDGQRTVRQLLAAKQEKFVREGRDTVIAMNDRRIAATLRRQGLALSSVLPPRRAVRLLEVANLSCGGTTVEVTDRIHPSVARLAVKVAAALDLRFAGIDLICRDATRPCRDGQVLEVNSAPGLDHYAGSGPEHEARIDELYLLLLKAVRDGRPGS